MKIALTFLFISISFLGFSQADNNEVITNVNGFHRFDGLDPLGGKVTVVYNQDFDKVYQERLQDSSKVYVIYSNRKIVEYGKITVLAENIIPDDIGKLEE